MGANTLPRLRTGLRDDSLILWEKEQEDSSLAPGGVQAESGVQGGLSNPSLAQERVSGKPCRGLSTWQSFPWGPSVEKEEKSQKVEMMQEETMVC